GPAGVDLVEVDTWEFAADAAGPAVELDVTASARCLAGKAYVAVRATNSGDVPADVALATPFGTRVVSDVAPGASAYQSFAARSTSLAAGVATVTGTAPVDGTDVSTPYEVAFDALACGG
ncbi:hypothetical protein, partial [Streptomyces sp. SID13726]|uniref:hypothetical protein n=1 Tax=Streptomyces sp. SID13726 TaxID=2706058 RepID=UPI0013B9090F